MFAPKWVRGPHNLARFPSWDPCITPGYWAWYLNALPTSGSLIRSLFYAFMPREGIYTCVFCPPPSSPQRRKPGYAALLRIRGNYFRPYLSIPRVCHRGAAYQWKFSYYFRWYVCAEMGTRAPLFSTFSLLGPLHYPWVLSVVFKCFANIRITFQIAFLCVHAPRGHIYLRFLPLLPPSVFPACAIEVQHINENSPTTKTPYFLLLLVRMYSCNVGKSFKLKNY